MLLFIARITFYFLTHSLLKKKTIFCTYNSRVLHIIAFIVETFHSWPFFGTPYLPFFIITVVCVCFYLFFSLSRKKNLAQSFVRSPSFFSLFLYLEINFTMNTIILKFRIRNKRNTEKCVYADFFLSLPNALLLYF